MKYKIRLTLCCIFCMCVFSNNAFADKIGPEQIYQKGLSAYESNDFNNALRLFEMIGVNVPYGINRDELVCMMRHSASAINNQDKAVKYAKLCNDSKYVKKISGKFVRFEEDKKHDAGQRRICLNLPSGKIVCEEMHVYTKISINRHVVYTEPYEDSCRANVTDKIDKVLKENFVKNVNADIFISYGDSGRSVFFIHINEPSHPIPQYKNVSDSYSEDSYVNISKYSTEVVKGRISDIINAGGYTYVRLAGGSEKEMWAAVPTTTLKLGDEFSLNGGVVWRNFDSNPIKKTFKKIMFSTTKSDVAITDAINSEAAELNKKCASINTTIHNTIKDIVYNELPSDLKLYIEASNGKLKSDNVRIGSNSDRGYALDLNSDGSLEYAFCNGEGQPNGKCIMSLYTKVSGGWTQGGSARTTFHVLNTIHDGYYDICVDGGSQILKFDNKYGYYQKFMK